MKFYLAEETWGRGWCVGWGTSDGELFLGQFDSDLMGYVVSEVKPTGRASDGRFYWETKTQAARAMRLARVQFREAQGQRVWPQWAKKAIAEGWKPPRRWRPPLGVVDGD